MDGVLKGFFVVGMVLLVGYILARTNALGPHGTKVLSTLTFMVGLPSLMFSTIASRHISEVLSQTGLISVVTALCVMALFALSGAIGKWGVRRTTIGALATGLAWLLAVLVFRLDTFSTFVVTACAILPTGQNVVLYAVRYGVAQNLAQSTAVITSALAVPLLLGAAWMFA
ncbi:AEC family transporter [uncultured Arthrobacter sp.]|uniref:AEC family transporter n=1 Tax=uncultured Arthrobacter sp. TaxID=114050 RepID=UPI0028D206DB|nr:AEC family transporter [uncultured Arthrobacter sp.]